MGVGSEVGLRWGFDIGVVSGNRVCDTLLGPELELLRLGSSGCVMGFLRSTLWMAPYGLEYVVASCGVEAKDHA